MKHLRTDYDAIQPFIESDGETVWVHYAGMTIARFGVRGIDIHTADTTGCLHCTHGTTNFGDWRIFQQKMFEHYYVTVGDEHMPERFLAELARVRG